jgi:hypothetical protein
MAKKITHRAAGIAFQLVMMLPEINRARRLALVHLTV